MNLKRSVYRLTPAQDKALEDLNERGLIATKSDGVRDAVEYYLENKFRLNITDYQVIPA